VAIIIIVKPASWASCSFWSVSSTQLIGEDSGNDNKRTMVSTGLHGRGCASKTVFIFFDFSFSELRWCEEKSILFRG
jgi:hypothetical protein